MEALAVYYSVALILFVCVVLAMKLYKKTEDTSQDAPVRRGRLKSSTSSAWENKKQLSKGTDSDSDDIMTETINPLLLKNRRMTLAMDELKAMDFDELRRHNHLNKRNTDRYWREIYRRKYGLQKFIRCFDFSNRDQLPEVINLKDLTKQNAVTALDERLPRGGLHGTEEFRIVAGRSGSSDGDAALQDHVIKYLRRRYPGNYEINTSTDGTIRITQSKN